MLSGDMKTSPVSSSAEIPLKGPVRLEPMEQPQLIIEQTSIDSVLHAPNQMKPISSIKAAVRQETNPAPPIAIALSKENPSSQALKDLEAAKQRLQTLERLAKDTFAAAVTGNLASSSWPNAHPCSFREQIMARSKLLSLSTYKHSFPGSAVCHPESR